MPGTPSVSRSSSPSRLMSIAEEADKPLDTPTTFQSITVHTQAQSVHRRAPVSLHDVMTRMTSLFAGLDSKSIRPEHLASVKHEFDDLVADINTLTCEDRLAQLRSLSTRLEKRRLLVPWFTPYAENLVAGHLENLAEDLSILALDPDARARLASEQLLQDIRSQLVQFPDDEPDWTFGTSQRPAPRRGATVEYKVPATGDSTSTAWHKPTRSEILSTQIADYLVELPNLVLDNPEVALHQGGRLAASIVQCPVLEQASLIEQLRGAVLAISVVYPPLLELLDSIPNAVGHTVESEDMPS